MIRIGTAGIPLSTKGTSLQDALFDLSLLNLGAIELQLVHGVMKPDDPQTLENVRRFASEVGVEINLHLPYYMDLVDDRRLIPNNKNLIKNFAIMGDMIGAKRIVIHIGPYGNYRPEEAVEHAIQNLQELRDFYLEEEISSRIAIENSGREMVTGDLTEIIDICRSVRFVEPVLNFAHLHSRTDGKLDSPEDFIRVFDMLQKTLNLEHFYAHFSGVTFKGGDERHILPIKRSDFNFQNLAKAILLKDIDITIISDSPLLEHDATYMWSVLESLIETGGYKETKADEDILKEKKKEKREQERTRLEELKKKKMDELKNI